MSVNHWTSLPSPNELKSLYPVPNTDFVLHCRNQCKHILNAQDPRIALIIGPCSIHNIEGALEYARQLKQLQDQVRDRYFLIMRVFIEKPRSAGGWKGLAYDPHLNGTNDLQDGLHITRSLLTELNSMSIPCATEFLDPLLAPYISDLICWGMIGARTTASQLHRQLASGLDFPIGFKNSIYGELDTAVRAVTVAKTGHTHFALNQEGKISAKSTTGNPYAHLVLRGSNSGPNCDPDSIELALQLLHQVQLPGRIAIDCAHGNSGKNIIRQALIFQDMLKQIKNGNQAIAALMLESYLEAGCQSNPIVPHLSITDPCLSFADTAALLI